MYCIDPQKLQLYIVVLGANHNHLSLCKGRDKIFRFFLGNSVVFQFTDRESYISIKYQGAIEKIGGEKNHEKFVVKAFWGVYLWSLFRKLN